MGRDFPLGECYRCALIYLAQQPKVHIIQPARVLVGGTGYCREHLPAAAVKPVSRGTLYGSDLS